MLLLPNIGKLAAAMRQPAPSAYLLLPHVLLVHRRREALVQATGQRGWLEHQLGGQLALALHHSSRGRAANTSAVSRAHTRLLTAQPNLQRRPLCYVYGSPSYSAPHAATPATGRMRHAQVAAAQLAGRQTGRCPPPRPPPTCSSPGQRA